MPPPRTPEDHQLQARREVGDRIRHLRHERGLSQERLGELAGGLDRRTIGRYENALSAATLDDLTSIARALGVATWRLFYG